MLLRILLTILVLLLPLAAPSPVHAQDDAARAIELVTQANGLYDSGDFRAALGKYREAYAITTDPRVLYRIGITYENLANYQRAREHLELYLYAEPDSKYAGRVKSKIENLRNLEKSLQSTIKIESTPSGASVWLDFEQGKPAGVTPVRLPVGPGVHEVLIRKEGFEDVRDQIDVGAGVSLEKTYDLGTGSAVVEKSPEPTEQSDGTEQVEQTTSDPAIYAGQPTRVKIGPSPGLSALSWISIAVGWGLIVGSGIFVGASIGGNGLIGTGFFAGAGLVALGSYFLWFRDYTKALPPATSAQFGIPPQRAMGIGITF